MLSTTRVVAAAFLVCAPGAALAQNGSYDGLDTHLGNLYRLSTARTFSISPENPTGEKGKGGMATEGTGASMARDLGPGWKISPSVKIGAGTTYTLAEITGSGAIQHILDDSNRELAPLDSADVLGRRARAVGGGPGG